MFYIILFKVVRLINTLNNYQKFSTKPRFKEHCTRQLIANITIKSSNFYFSLQRLKTKVIALLFPYWYKTVVV